MADLTDIQAAQAVKIVGSDSTGLEQTPVGSDASGNLNTVVNNTTLNPVPITGNVNVEADKTSGFYPDPSSCLTGSAAPLRVDSDNNLQVRAEVFSDAGSFRDDFVTSPMAVNITGTITVTNGSNVITGMGTLFTSELKIKNYIKLSTHADSAYARILTVDSDTHVTLANAYTGANGTGTGTKSPWKTSTVNSASVNVASSILSLSSGTLNGASAIVRREVDYGPLSLYADVSITQRAANQVAYFGFVNDPTNIQSQAIVVFDGTNPSFVKFRTSSSSSVSDIEETVIQLKGLNTSQLLDWQIDLTFNKVTLSVEGDIIAEHTDHIPGPYEVLETAISIANAAVTSNTTLNVHVISVTNVDQLQINNTFIGGPIDVRITDSKNINTQGYTSCLPDVNDREGVLQSLTSDVGGGLRTRSQILTDEGSFRDDFRGVSNFINLTGSLTFINGNTLVTGVGTLFTSELATDRYIKLISDAESVYESVVTIISDTELQLDHPYGGTSNTGSAISTRWKPTTGTGSLSISNSAITVGSGTTSGNFTSIEREGDYQPMMGDFRLSVSQRIANQTIRVGFVDPNNISSPTYGVYIEFTGTDNTKVNFVTKSFSDASNTQTTAVTLPKFVTTDVMVTYTIDVTNKGCNLSINDEIVATNNIHSPGTYDAMNTVISVSNASVVTNTNIVLDYVTVSNDNRVTISNNYGGTPAKVQVMGKSITTGLYQDLILDNNGNLIVTALTGFGAAFTFGDVATAALTEVVVRRTTYTEQSTNAQRSIASANANDTAGGTGARTVIITYFDQTGAGPYTELITLNGTTGVNTVNTNVCFIEKIVVDTVGSSGSNTGIITLYSSINKGGVAIGTIGATDNQTYWAHHYVPLGKTINVTGISASHNGTTVGSGAVFRMFSTPVPIANKPNIQVSDSVRLYGQSSTFSRVYQSPIKISGPARLEMRCTPESASSITYRASFDYFEPQ